MCGVGGFLWMGKGSTPFDAERRLRAMIKTVRHRGPDDEGIWTDHVCGLAHARLSIIDLSPAAHQPMGSADGRVWVSFNGEIYNFLELRRELETKGYVFRSHSDTEVIVYGYAAWGEKVFTRLRGMFAIAIWDHAKQKLILGRDRFGKKPLYYARIRDLILFGSEIKELLTWPEVSRQPDNVAIDQFLSLQYVPSPRTAFEAVRKVPPAHYMVVERVEYDWLIGEPVNYWRLPQPRLAENRLGNKALEVELIERLKESVKLRLISDVPLGAFLRRLIGSRCVDVRVLFGSGQDLLDRISQQGI
jgi:asparagine synthase (glutamine-hydrolysing)